MEGGDGVLTILPLDQNKLILIGRSNSNIGFDKSELCRGDYDFWVMIADTNLNHIWDKTIGGSANEVIGNASILQDGSLILAGSSNSPISGDKRSPSIGRRDVWVVKLKPDQPMALEEITLQGKLWGEEAFLQWKPSLENQQTRYFIERKPMNKGDFTVIGNVIAQGKEIYSYKDSKIPVDGAFYRIKAMGEKESVSYSRVIQLRPVYSKTFFRIHPNPIGDVLQAEYALVAPAFLVIIDPTGLEVFRYALERGQGRIEVPVPFLASGIYTAFILPNTNNTTYIQKIRLVKQ